MLIYKIFHWRRACVNKIKGSWAPSVCVLRVRLRYFERGSGLRSLVPGEGSGPVSLETAPFEGAVFPATSCHARGEGVGDTESPAAALFCLPTERFRFNFICGVVRPNYVYLRSCW